MSTNGQVYGHSEISDDWIEKYRAAMEPVPAQQAQATESTSFFDRAVGKAMAASRNVAEKWRQFVAQ
jgi:hypothetical protein